MSALPVAPLPKPPWSPECAICKKSVKLEESKADEYGQAVHEECYVAKLTQKKPEFLNLG